MAGTYLAQIVLERVNALPEDQVVNTLHYLHQDAGDPTSADWDALAASISDFYNVPTAGTGNNVALYINRTISRLPNDHLMRFYKVPAAPGLLGSPVAARSWTLAAGGAGKTLPGEVAVVMSYNAILTDVPETAADGSRPRARRRGRLYVGPLADSASAALITGTEFARPLAAMTTTVREAAQENLSGPLNFAWMIFSRADWLGRGVVQVSTDDAFDTQRRRGTAPTARAVTNL